MDRQRDNFNLAVPAWDGHVRPLLSNHVVVGFCRSSDHQITRFLRVSVVGFSFGSYPPSTAFTLSDRTLTSRSISASVMTSGGAKNTWSPGAGCSPATGRVLVTTPRFIISPRMRAATLRS